jgi:hypothetical protein
MSKNQRFCGLWWLLLIAWQGVPNSVPSASCEEPKQYRDEEFKKVQDAVANLLEHEDVPESLLGQMPSLNRELKEKKAIQALRSHPKLERIPDPQEERWNLGAGWSYNPKKMACELCFKRGDGCLLCVGVKLKLAEGKYEASYIVPREGGLESKKK